MCSGFRKMPDGKIYALKQKYEGTNHPQYGFEPNFLGIFGTESSAEKALEKIGELIEF